MVVEQDDARSPFFEGEPRHHTAVYRCRVQPPGTNHFLPQGAIALVQKEGPAFLVVKDAKVGSEQTSCHLGVGYGDVRVAGLLKGSASSQFKGRDEGSSLSEPYSRNRTHCVGRQ